LHNDIEIELRNVSAKKLKNVVTTTDDKTLVCLPAAVSTIIHRNAQAQAQDQVKQEIEKNHLRGKTKSFFHFQASGIIV